jgi:DNA-directed RNA polymerase sigma subunit (sigma70/sigma32)
MSSFWQTEDGWPYADVEGEEIDLDAEVDEDLLAVRLATHQALDGLDPLEREVVAARFGLEGHPLRSMKQLRGDLGIARADIRSALGTGLEKLRATLA